MHLDKDEKILIGGCFIVFVWSLVSYAIIFNSNITENLLALNFLNTIVSYLPIIIFALYYFKRINGSFKFKPALLIIVLLFIFILTGIYNSCVLKLHIIAAVMGLISLLLVGFFEELYFRGLLYGKFKETKGKKKAVMISSLLFASVHLYKLILTGNMESFIIYLISIIIAGYVFVYFYEKTESLWISVILHALYDLIRNNCYFYNHSIYVGIFHKK